MSDSIADKFYILFLEENGSLIDKRHIKNTTPVFIVHSN